MTRNAADLERRLENVTEKLLAAFEELEFVYGLADRFARSGEGENLDKPLLRETLGILRSDGGWVSRRDAEGNFRTTAVSGFPPSVPETLTALLVAPLAAENALPYLVDDLQRELARRPKPVDPDRTAARDVADELPRAFVVAPLIARSELLGVICLGKRKPGDLFTAGDGKLLTALAIQAGLFIKNADLMQRLRAEARTLGRRVRELESDPRAHPDLSWIRGPSEASHALARQIESAAATDATVLLLGESGTGKSLAARILHRLSGRNRGPFVEVNCGAIAPGLIESELFGHARGAFTGAERERDGLFQAAQGGTILLDEVADLPAEAQVKLLRVLEEHKVRRVGENRDRPVDARVVAATNLDLGDAVRRGRFREDLFYRLNVIRLTVPPLRERRDDILPLARRFLEDLARETNRRLSGFSPAAAEALLTYSWPGNVRELRNVVERSLLLKRSGDMVERDDLPPLGPIGWTSAQSPAGGEPLPEAMRGYERRLIQDALRRQAGVVSRAAQDLGISRTNLHNKLRKHGLVARRQWDDGRHES